MASAKSLLRTLYTNSSLSQKSAGMRSLSLPLAGRLHFRRVWTSGCPSHFVKAELLLYASDITVSTGWSVISAEAIAHLEALSISSSAEGGFA